MAKDTAAEPERAGIADMDERGLAVRPQHRGKRGPHAQASGILGHPAGNLGVRRGNGAGKHLEQLAGPGRDVTGAQGLDNRSAGHLAGRVAAHPVSDGEQPPTRMNGVLVARANYGVGRNTAETGRG